MARAGSSPLHLPPPSAPVPDTADHVTPQLERAPGEKENRSRPGKITVVSTASGAPKRWTMLQKLRKLFSARERDARLQAQLERLRQRTPVPIFWLFGRTQSGKTSVVRYLTGAADAEIGQGFRPCTRFSRLYQFPTADAPLLTFLDT